MSFQNQTCKAFPVIWYRPGVQGIDQLICGGHTCGAYGVSWQSMRIDIGGIWGMMVGMFQKPDTHKSPFIEQIQLHYGNQKKILTSLTWRFDRWSIWANSAVTEGGTFPT